MRVAKDYDLVDLTAIKQMAKAGLAHAAEALAPTTTHQFEMQVPAAHAVALEDVPSAVGQPEEVVVAVLVPISGEVEGHIAFLFPWDSACQIWLSLVGTTPFGPKYVDELSSSVMLGLGDVLNSGFLKAIQERTGFNLSAKPPQISIDLCHAITASIVAKAEFEEAVALAVETELFEYKGKPVRGHFLYVPHANGLDLMVSKLRASEAA
ncbi:MAG: chemotaxis protein CheC [Armatimonadota bacterium]